MYSHRFNEDLSLSVILHWFMLSFNGGYINAGGFLATGRFVSHVTGFATLFGVDIANNEIDIALGILSVPIFFLAGAFIAGLLIDRPLYRKQTPHVDWVMGLSALCLFAASAAGYGINFNDVGAILGLKESYLLLILLCLASGLQNAAITSSSGKTVRTTHLTGLTTDLGLGLARVFTFDLQKDSIKRETRSNYLRIGSILSFIGGSMIGAWIFLNIGYQGFIFSAVISTYAAWKGRKAKITAHELSSL